MSEKQTPPQTYAAQIGLIDGQFTVQRTDGSQETGWVVDHTSQIPDPNDPSKSIDVALIVKPGLTPEDTLAKRVRTEELLSWQPQPADNLDDDTTPTAVLHAQLADDTPVELEAAAGLEQPQSPEEDNESAVAAAWVEDARKIYQDPELAMKLMRQEVPLDDEASQVAMQVLTYDARTVLPYREAQEQLAVVGREVHVILDRLDPTVAECAKRVLGSYERVKQLKDVLQDAKRVFESDLYNTPRDRASDLIDRIEHALSSARSNPALAEEIAAIGGLPEQLTNFGEATENIGRSAYILRDDPNGLRGTNALALNEAQQQLLLTEAVSLGEGKAQQMHDEVADAESKALVAKHVAEEVSEEALRLASGIRGLPEGSVVGYALGQIDTLTQHVRMDGFSARSLGNFVAELRAIIARVERLEEDLGVVGSRARFTEEFVKKLQECSGQLDNAKILAA